MAVKGKAGVARVRQQQSVALTMSADGMIMLKVLFGLPGNPHPPELQVLVMERHPPPAWFLP